ncbi:unnamed protein product [Lampetra planeri]
MSRNQKKPFRSTPVKSPRKQAQSCAVRLTEFADDDQGVSWERPLQNRRHDGPPALRTGSISGRDRRGIARTSQVNDGSFFSWLMPATSPNQMDARGNVAA